jgi:predicted dehydrogenase
MEPVRIGFIGAGIFSTWAIYPALHLAPVDLRVVCDLEEVKAQDAARNFGSPGWCTDYRQVLRRDDLEAVIIWMGPGPRRPLVQEALEAGLHVLVPKPPAMSLHEAKSLSETARQANKSLMVHFHRRFSFGVRKAMEIAAQPSFGRLTQLLCSFCSGAYNPVRAAGYESAVHGYLLDFAIHHIDLARYLGGEVSQAAVFHNDIGGDGSFALALQFASGAVGTLQLTGQRIWWRNYDRIELTGQGQYVVLDGIWGLRHYTQEHNTFTENYSDERSTELGGDADALTEFAAAIREGREPIANIHDALGSMRLYQAIYDAYLAGHQGALDLEMQSG